MCVRTSIVQISVRYYYPWNYWTMIESKRQNDSFIDYENTSTIYHKYTSSASITRCMSKTHWWCFWKYLLSMQSCHEFQIAITMHINSNGWELTLSECFGIITMSFDYDYVQIIHNRSNHIDWHWLAGWPDWFRWLARPTDHLRVFSTMYVSYFHGSLTYFD